MSLSDSSIDAYLTGKFDQIGAALDRGDFDGARAVLASCAADGYPEAEEAIMLAILRGRPRRSVLEDPPRDVVAVDLIPWMPGGDLRDHLMVDDTVLLDVPVVEAIPGVTVLVEIVGPDGKVTHCHIREDLVGVRPTDPPHIAERVLVRGQVLNVFRDAVDVQLYSKTDSYTHLVGAASVYALMTQQPPAEPADGSWLVGVNDYDGELAVFHRDDTAAPAVSNPSFWPRWTRHWFDVAAREWVGWPTAYNRGASLRRTLHETK